MISAILLSAGQSKRMRNENKLAKKINDKPLIVHSVENILSSPIDELIIVVGYQKEIIEKFRPPHVWKKENGKWKLKNAVWHKNDA